MALEKRVVTIKDQDVLYRRPIEQLSNFELLSVVEAGTRLMPSLTETLLRLRSDSSFIDEMFEFGDSQTAAIGNKFKDWFSSHLGDTPRIEASIISEISKSEKYGHRAQEFMPGDLRFYFDGFSDTKKFKVIESWLTCLEFPERFFSSSQGMITPVILAIKHLSNYDSLSDINKCLSTFFSRNDENAASVINGFTTGGLRDSLRQLVETFVSARARPIEEMAEFISILSRFDNKNFRPSIHDGYSDIQKLLSSRLVSDEFLEKTIDARIKCKPSTKDTLLDEINSDRSYRIISKFYERSELMDAGRKIRGYLLGDDLGM